MLKLVLSHQRKICFWKHESFTVKPSATEIVPCSLNHGTFPDGSVAIVEPNPKYEKETGLCVTSAFFKLDKAVKFLSEL